MTAQTQLAIALDALERIALAAEFHSQDGISDDVRRYAHESTARLANEALGKIYTDKTCPKCGGTWKHNTVCADCGFTT